MTKTLFVRILDELRDGEDLVTKIGALIQSYDRKYKTDFPEPYGLVVEHEDIIVKLLEEIMRDHDGLISWWCFEKDFGRSFEFGDVTDNGRNIPLFTPDDLWTYLTEGTNS